MLDLHFIPAGAQFARNNMQREHTMNARLAGHFHLIRPAEKTRTFFS
jgi:hypothetical protein